MRSNSFCLDIKLRENEEGNVVICKDYVELYDISKLTVEEIDYILGEAISFSKYVEERKKVEKERNDIKDIIIC